MKYLFSIVLAGFLILAGGCDTAGMIQVSAPELFPAGGTYTDDVQVTISCATEDAEISWRKSTSGSWMSYTEAISVSSNTTIETRASFLGSTSDEVVAAYIINRLKQVKTPVVHSPVKVFAETIDVSISCSTIGAEIEYSTDSGTVWSDYTGPVSINETTALIARASKEGMADSIETDPVSFRKSPYVSPDRVTIATYNVENFDLGSDSNNTYPDQYSYIAQFAKDEGIEILVVQEMQTNDSDIAGFSGALESIDYPMLYLGQTSMSDNWNAIAVWSRFPITVEPEVLDPPGPRSLLRFRAHAGVNEIWFYGAHLKSGADIDSFNRRVTQSGALEAYILENHDPLNENIVLLGDMNTMGYDGGPVNEDFSAGGTLENLELKSDNDSTNDFYAVNYHVLSHEVYFTNPGWDSLLDHIILSPAAYSHYENNSIKVVQPAGDGKYGASDHYPVVLELTF